MKRILVLGPRYKPGRTVGGAVVLFENLIEEFKKNNIPFDLIDTNKAAFSSRLRSLVDILCKTATGIRKNDIVFINSSADYFLLLPPIFFLNIFFRKKIYLRKFGGEVDKSLNNKIKGKFIRYYFPKLSGLFLESKFLVEKFKPIVQNVYWFPNVRAIQIEKKQPEKTGFTGKFVFISQIRYTKGVQESIEAFRDFTNGYSLDFYGPLLDSELQEVINGSPNVSYKGELLPQDVYSTLSNYDVLILPTYYKGEGYPGIIIEAYACGIPVITTNWNHIPEIVVDGVTGFLIGPKSSEAIKMAVEKFNADVYQNLALNAKKKFMEFDSAIVTENILKILNQ